MLDASGQAAALGLRNRGCTNESVAYTYLYFQRFRLRIFY